MQTSDLIHEWDANTGTYVSEKHRRVAEIIHDYDETLQLVFIPPKDRSTPEDHKVPFAILHTPPNQQPYIVRAVAESEVDERLLAWLWSNDGERGDPFATLQKIDEAQKVMEAHAAQEARDEAMEIGASILKSKKHTFKHNGKVYE